MYLFSNVQLVLLTSLIFPRVFVAATKWWLAF